VWKPHLLREQPARNRLVPGSNQSPISRDGTLVGKSGPDGLFTKIGEGLRFLSEQFWGRAARASNDSKESDARFLLCDVLVAHQQSETLLATSALVWTLSRHARPSQRRLVR